MLVLTYAQGNVKTTDLLLMINDQYTHFRGSFFKPVDNNEVLTISSDKKSVRLIDSTSALPIREFYGFVTDTSLGAVTCADVNQKKELLVTGGLFKPNDLENSTSANIRVYDYRTSKLLKTLPQKEIPSMLIFNHDGSLLIAASKREIVFWDVNTSKMINSLDLQDDLIDLKVYRENGFDVLIFATKNNIISKYSIESNKVLASYKAQDVKTIDVSSKYILTISSSKNPAISVYDHDLRLQKYLTIVEDMTSKNGFELKDKIDIFKLGKNSLTETALMYFDSKPLVIKDIYTESDMLYMLTEDNVLLTIRMKENWSIVQVNKELKKKYSSVKAWKNQLYLQDDDGYIYQSNLDKGEQKNSFSNNKNIFEKILHTKLLSLSSEYNNYELSNVIDMGYTLSVKELKSLQLEAARSIFDNNGMFDAKLTKKGVLFLFQDALYNSMIKTEEYSTYGFLDENIVIGYNSGLIKFLDTTGKELTTINIDNNPIEKIYYSKEYLICIDSNNIAKVWDRNKRLLLCSIFIDRNNEYVIWTEEGYFTVSSSEALKYITWNMNHGYENEAFRYDLSKFYDVFFRPDLVKLKLEGKDISQYTGGLTAQDALKSPPPSVIVTAVEDNTNHIIHSIFEESALTIKQSKVKVRFSVNDEGGGVGTIRVYQEGKLIETIGIADIKKVVANADIKSDEQVYEQSKKTTLALAKSVNKENLTFEDRIGPVTRNTRSNQPGIYEVEVNLKKGMNSISIEAFNSTNTITSFQASVNLKAEIAKQPSKLYAIVAGVNTFESSFIPNLKYAVNDALMIKEEIEKSKNKIYDDVEVIYLTDIQVSKMSLENAFQTIQKKASVNDTVVFYISTHGTSANGTFYLFPSNNANANQFIDFNDLFTMSSSIKALNQVFMVDACQSGGAVDIASAVYDSRASVMARSAGIHLLSASTSGTNAFENDEAHHGAFTYQILSALKDINNDTNKDGFISVIEISEQLKKKQQNEVLKDQFPVIRNVGSDVMIYKW